MKFGHRLHGKIEGFDDKGRGFFTLDTGSTVVIPFTAEGDELSATFMRRDRGVKIAKLEELKQSGPDRVTPPCPHAGICGGCLWQHLAYDAQIRLKQEMVNRAFERAGHEERIADVLPSMNQLYYRNRMDYAVGWLGTIGLKEYGSWNKYLDLSTCLLLSKDAGEILNAARLLMHEHGLEPWDAKHHSGQFRYVVIREGKQTGERLIALIVKEASSLTNAQRTAMLNILSSYCTSLLIGEQSKITDISYAQTYESLKGDPWIHEIANGIRYRIAPNSFFQTNTVMAEKLQDVVGAQLNAPNTILDLYCGLGFFGIAAARRFPNAQIHGFEIDAEAIELAKHNARENGAADRCAFTSGPAEDLSWKDIPADTVILDPPRSGLHPRVLKTILEQRPKTIVYVSCNYHRCVEELKEFKRAYRIESIHALDLFPHTPHVEMVTKLTLV